MTINIKEIAAYTLKEFKSEIEDIREELENNKRKLYSLNLIIKVNPNFNGRYDYSNIDKRRCEILREINTLSALQRKYLVTMNAIIEIFKNITPDEEQTLVDDWVDELKNYEV